MNSVTQPLGYRRFLKTQPALGFDLLPFFDAVLIVLIIALNGSRFVTAPGATIELTQIQQTIVSLNMPKAVLTVDRNELAFFGGQKIAPGNLTETLSAHIQQNSEDKTLLIKADVSLSTETLFDLFNKARSAGFERVHLAAEVAESNEDWIR